MSQRGIRRREQQRRKQRYVNIGLGCVCAVVAILAVVLVGRQLIGAGGEEKSAKMSKAASESQKELVIDQQAAAVQEEETEEKAGTEVPDRSNFAVQPGNVPGGFEQTGEKVVYLTLDDGPSQNTQTVLDILDRYDAKATFFVTGAMPEYAGMIKTAYDKGHTIGLHTYSHDYASVYASVDAYFQDLDAVGQVVAEQIGYVPCFIRFPGGSSNTVSANYSSGIMTALSQEVQNRGYQYYDWNASSGDGSNHTTEELVAQGTSFSENNIVLLSHDSAAKQTTMEALPRIIEYYQSQGYVFKALDREAFVPHHVIGN